MARPGSFFFAILLASGKKALIFQSVSHHLFIMIIGHRQLDHRQEYHHQQDHHQQDHHQLDHRQQDQDDEDDYHLVVRLLLHTR